MGGPWEKYASTSDTDQSDDSSGPWSKYSSGSQSPDAGFSFDGLKDAAMSGLSKASQFVDSYTVAPTRAALGSLENDPTNIGGAMDAFGKQFGADPSVAPTGKDLAAKLGLSTDSFLSPDMQKSLATMIKRTPIGMVANVEAPGAIEYVAGASPAGVVGTGIDFAANPLNFIPGVAEAGAAEKVAAGLEDVAGASKIAAKTPGVMARASGAVGETATGIDKSLVANYVSNTDRINNIISNYKGADGALGEADYASDIRDAWRKNIQGTRQQMNNDISSALEGAQGDKKVSAQSLNNVLDTSIDRAHPVTQQPDIKTLGDLKDKLGQMTDANGNISLRDLHAFKQYAYKVAEPAYDPIGNAIFPGGDFAAKQAKVAAGEARTVLSDLGPKSVTKAEGVLSDLHNAEDTMNSTMLKDNGPVHAIARAATNPGGSEARSLNQLSQVTGYNFAQDAKDFATVRAFATPKYLPTDLTGKSLARLALSTAVLGPAAHGLGVPPEYAAMIGAAGSSPAVLKAGINVTNLAGKAASVPVDALAAARDAGLGVLSSQTGQAATRIGAGAIPALSTALQRPAIPVPATAQSKVNRSPAGPDAWAQQGLSNLGIRDPGVAQKLMSDPMAKNLLIHASGLQPGSVAMKNVIKQIQSRLGASQ